METRIEELPSKILVGKSVRMSLNNNRTFELWNGFMTSRRNIENGVGTDLYSIQVYDNLHYFEKFDPGTEFTKWAAIEVENHTNIPKGFSAFSIKTGSYAVFVHKGTSAEFPKTFQYILGIWLPQSDFELDDRPHFELLGAKYKNNDLDSEEEIWIPIRQKTKL